MHAQKKEIREEKRRDKLSYAIILSFMLNVFSLFLLNLFFLGKKEQFLVQGDELPSITGQASFQQLPDKGTCPPATTKESPVLKLSLEGMLDPSAKIKLQLFPIDEGTRIRLERVKL